MPACESDAPPDVPDALADWLDEFGGPVEQYDVPADDEQDKPFQPLPYEVVGSDPSWASAAAESLAHNGFCVLRPPQPLVADDARRECQDVAASRLDRCFEHARQLGLAPRRDVMRFAEVCSRTLGGQRFDQCFWRARDQAVAEAGEGGAAAAAQPPLPPCWAELRRAVESWVLPVLACGGNGGAHADSVGCVTSLPGAPDQHFHPDGTAAGLVNVFCPLVEVTAENGPTELRPGSHSIACMAYGWAQDSQESSCHGLHDI